MAKVSPGKPTKPWKDSVPRACWKLELTTRPTSHLSLVVQIPGAKKRDLEKRLLRLCFLHQESQNQRNQLLLTRSHHPQPHPRGEVRPESLGWKIGRIKREGSKSQKKRTYRVQAQVSVVSSGAVPRLLARCSALLVLKVPWTSGVFAGSCGK